MHRVFVYGTLKRGLRNHRFLENATFVGEAYTVTRFFMIDGRFPVLRDAGPNLEQVGGEVYVVNDRTLAQLDELEDIASRMYDRLETEIVLSSSPNGELSRAFIYIGGGDYWDKKEQVPYRGIDELGHLNWVAPDKRSK